MPFAGENRRGFKNVDVSEAVDQNASERDDGQQSGRIPAVVFRVCRFAFPVLPWF